MEKKATEILQNTNELILQFYDLIIRYSVSFAGAVIILCVGWLIAGAMQRWTIASLSAVRGLDHTIVRFFGGAIRYAVLAIIIVMVLGQLGVQTASILAALGAVGLAIGLALQGTLQNIAAGIMLLILRPFRIGEYISAGDISGTVQEIGLFTTELKTYDGLFLVTPNSTLWNTTVTNFSRLQSRLHDFKVRIDYRSDIDEALRIVLEIAQSQQGVLVSPKPYCFVDELGESSVIICCRYWISNELYWNAVRATTRLTKERFSAAGIPIPYPQVTYHLPNELISGKGNENS